MKPLATVLSRQGGGRWGDGGGDLTNVQRKATWNPPVQ
jgi:hypothetical protein